MLFTVPNSFGARVTEVNHCDDPETGRETLAFEYTYTPNAGQGKRLRLSPAFDHETDVIQLDLLQDALHDLQVEHDKAFAKVYPRLGKAKTVPAQSRGVRRRKEITRRSHGAGNLQIS